MEVSENFLYELGWKHRLQQIQRYLLHDVSNCLAGSLALSELYCENTQGENLQGVLKTIRDNCYRERQLLQLSSVLNRPSVEVPAYVEVRAFFEHMRPIFTCVLSPQVTLDIDVTSLDVCTLGFNATLLQRIFLQLISNADEALESVEKPAVSIKNSVEGQQWVCVLTDNGRGFTEATSLDTFRPLPAKDENHSGLGLAMSYAYLTAAQGRLKLTSQPHQGTSVAIQLPINL